MNTIWIVLPILTLLMFDLGLALRFEDFGSVFRRPWPIVVALVGQLVFLPAIALGLAYLLKLLPLCLALQWWQGIQIGILWMEGEDTDTGIGIRVGPRMGERGIIDRQDLQNSLTGGRNPVNHLLQIAKVTYTKTGSATQREDRHQCSGETFLLVVEDWLGKFKDQTIASLNKRQCHRTVVTSLPNRITAVLDNHELIGDDRTMEGGGVKNSHPLIGLMLAHHDSLAEIPTT